MSSNSSSCPTPGGGHLNGYTVPPYAFFFPPMLGGLSPPGALTTLQHQLPVSGYRKPSPASKWGGAALWEGAVEGGRPEAGLLGTSLPQRPGLLQTRGTAWTRGLEDASPWLCLALGVARSVESGDNAVLWPLTPPLVPCR